MNFDLARKLGLATAMSLCAAGVALPAAAVAQQSESNSTEPSVPAQADYSQKELESFAKASLAVDRINSKWTKQIAEAQSEEETKEMRQEAISEMSSAIEDEGLTVKTYNSIFDAAERNPEIARRIKDFRKQHR